MNEIEVHYDKRFGVLILSCGDEAFARVRKAVITAAGLDDASIDGVPSGVREINLRQDARAPKRQTWLRDRLALLGCGLVAFGILFVLVGGLGTIIGWLR